MTPAWKIGFLTSMDTCIRVSRIITQTFKVRFLIATLFIAMRATSSRRSRLMFPYIKAQVAQLHDTLVPTEHLQPSSLYNPIRSLISVMELPRPAMIGEYLQLREIHEAVRLCCFPLMEREETKTICCQ